MLQKSVKDCLPPIFPLSLNRSHSLALTHPTTMGDADLRPLLTAVPDWLKTHVSADFSPISVNRTSVLTQRTRPLNQR